MAGETAYKGKRRGSFWQFVSTILLPLLVPAYPIGSSQMRPVTKIKILGVRLAVVVLAAYWLTIFFGTHLPASVSNITPHVSDKVKHFWAFFVLSGLLCYVTNSPRWVVRFASIGLVAMAYAAVDEFTQRFVPGRVPDLADFVADSIGVWSAIAIYLAGKSVHHFWTTRTASF